MQKIKNSTLLVSSLVLTVTFCFSVVLAQAQSDKQVTGAEHRSTVSTSVQSLLNAADKEQGGVGEQVRGVAQQLSESNDRIANALDKIQNRNKFKTFLIGTDYNNGVKGVGPKTALRLVKQHKNFEDLFKEIKADFNWKQIYSTFKNMPVIKNYQLKWVKPDVESIMKLLVDEHEFNQERVQKNLDRIINIKKAPEQGSLTKYF